MERECEYQNFKKEKKLYITICWLCERALGNQQKNCHHIVIVDFWCKEIGKC